MIWLFVYGGLMRKGPYSATVHGEMRYRTGGDPSCHFGAHYPGLVYGQLRPFTSREVEQLSVAELPQYALRRIGIFRGYEVHAFEGIEPNFEQHRLIPDGMWDPVAHYMSGARIDELVQKAKRRGQGHKPPGKIKVVVTEARLNAMQTAMERPVKVGILSGITTMRQNLTADDMRRAFMRKDYSAVTEHLGRTFKGITEGIVLNAVGGVHDDIMRKLPVGVARDFTYTPDNPRIAKYIASRSGELVTTSEDGIREAVRAMTSAAMTRGMTPPQSAAFVRDSIGLNAPQARALANYRAGLAESGDLPAARIEQMTADQVERMLDYRATMIARTEVRNAQNHGQLDIWKQGLEDELLPQGSEKVWQVDGAPCDEWCSQMDGESVPIHDKFRVRNTRTGEVVEVDVPSEVHPHCMCIMQISME